MRETLTHRPPWRLALPFALLALIAGGLPTLLISNSIARVYAEADGRHQCRYQFLFAHFLHGIPGSGINSLGAQAAAWINEDN